MDKVYFILFVTFIIGTSVMIVHEITHATLCTEYGGNATINWLGPYVQCSITNSELTLLDAWVEVIGYASFIFLILIFYFVILRIDMNE